MYELVSPVKLLIVLKYLSVLVMGAGGMLLVPPLVVALYFGEYTVAGIYTIIGFSIILLGFFFHRLLPEGELEWKEALIIAAVIFPFAALLSAIPFTLSTGMPFLDAYFEAVSGGVTTTGLSVAPATVGPAFLFARSWLQWVGGASGLLLSSSWSSSHRARVPTACMRSTAPPERPPCGQELRQPQKCW
ncbi:hypothetical protein [Methanogenium cariaci]|uniref:hypothetical protein n=1 Tax=Methanogenium cariaci TaxID=2197 RepID=UPI001C48E087|nr:hypothetical protein [Methanogenium cariaci]